ncbi:hypothetical protein Lal_00016641 [Lupinus albus]|nr:hypothetical protein Lal_00016641 [Lupinus albus]
MSNEEAYGVGRKSKSECMRHRDRRQKGIGKDKFRMNHGFKTVEDKGVAVGQKYCSAHMIHGPCGSSNRSSPCMKDGKCSRYFPKKFSQTTFVDEDGYLLYRRRDNGNIVEKMIFLLTIVMLCLTIQNY